jgi:hypothetical protein
MAPYEVTRPLGICLATWKTSSKNDSSRLPDGFIENKVSRDFIVFAGLCICV